MEKVDLPVHNHPLLPLTRFSHGRCKGCWSHGYIYGGYRCNELGCDTLFYKECAESLPDINHSSHPDHPLKLVRKFQSSICSLCQVWFDTGYFCSICDFKLDLGCAWRPSPPLTLENTDTHEHQLVLSNGVGSELSQSTRNCKVCSSEVLEFKQYYECHQCELFFHVKCTKISLEEYHTSHPEHPLKFLTGDEAPGYADKKGCAENSSPLSVMSTKTHEHQLHLFQRLVDFTCNACGTRGFFKRINFVKLASPKYNQSLSTVVSNAITSFTKDMYDAAPFEHDSHPHPLYYYEKTYKHCSAHGGGMKIGMLSCDECDYSLDFKCALLPKMVVNHRKFDQLAKRSVLARGDFGDYESDSRSSISAVSYGSRDGFSGGPGRSSASVEKIVEGASGRINDTTTKEQERGQIVENEEGETGKGETGEEVKEMEEGQINEWQNVSTEKMGRSPKNDLKYGQVIIATPSRRLRLKRS
ncbi:hypothetical protein HID58_032618 [Brassica napus]|uniref:DC1 domain-containing protein n=1 Tax=Brassica napus TaxID=3708 RepID=A0ABQ8BWV1_BRANA|nr:hypothetical protein HID58_032618 [Brassica napus]